MFVHPGFQDSFVWVVVGGGGGDGGVAVVHVVVIAVVFVADVIVDLVDDIGVNPGFQDSSVLL